MNLTDPLKNHHFSAEKHMHALSFCPSDLTRVHRLNSRPASRRFQIAITILVSLFAVNTGFAQKKPVVEDRTLRTEDTVDIKISYFKAVSTEGKNAPVVILLHGKSENRQKWKDIATVLQEMGGFAVVTVDLRGHGDSQFKTKRIDQEMAVRDMEAVKEFLFEEHQHGHLNMNKTGIVGCDFSAAVAIVYTEYDWLKEPYDDSPTPNERTPRGQDIQALVLVSPDVSTPGLFASKSAGSLREFDKLAVMVAASEKSGNDFAASKKVFDQMTSKRVKSDQHILTKYPEDLRGLNLVLHDDKLKNDIADFLTKHVKDRDIPWRDRRSHLDR